MDYERISGQTHGAFEVLCEKSVTKHSFHEIFKHNNVVFSESDSNLPSGIVLIVQEEKCNVQIDNVPIAKGVSFAIGLKAFCMFVRVVGVDFKTKGKLKQILNF